MHAISSYRGNRPTNKHTNRQGRLQYTAPQLAQCNNIELRYVTSMILYEVHEEQSFFAYEFMTFRQL